MTEIRHWLHSLFAFTLGPAFVWVGVQHFVNPGFFQPIVPEILGSPPFWVYASGAVEVGLGVAMIHPRFRKVGGYATAAFLIVVYWANLNMWMNEIPLNGTTFSTQAHIARGIAQLVMIGMALHIAIQSETEEKEV